MLALELAGCTGHLGQADDACVPDPGDQAPEAPAIVAPASGARDVVGDLLVVSASGFEDPDDTETPAESEFEIWAVADGEPVARVWSATRQVPAELTEVTLGDGTFETITALAEFADYGVRARYRATGSGCDRFSEWSEWTWFRTDDGSSYLFDPAYVHDIYLDIPAGSWAAIDAEAVPDSCEPWTRSYYPGTLRFEDKTYLDVGIRAKGGCGSARHLNGKAGFKVNLGWDDPAVPGCPDDRRLYGLKRLTLNNMVQDRTFMHERLLYPLYEAMGLPAPRATHVRLFVNDQLWGLYTHIETIDRRYLARWFESNRGMLYEGTYWCDLIPDNLPVGLDDSGCLTRKFAADECSPEQPGDDPTDYQVLRQFVEAVAAMPQGQFYPEIEQMVDFDAFLSSWAVDGVIANWDDYAFSLMNNYRVYHDPSTGLWTLIQTGIDQTMHDNDLDPFQVSGVLAARCMGEADCAAAYAQRLAEANTVFENMGLAADAQAIFGQVSDSIAEDPRKEIDYATFVDNYNTMLTWISLRPDRVRQFLANHGY